MASCPILWLLSHQLTQRPLNMRRAINSKTFSIYVVVILTNQPAKCECEGQENRHSSSTIDAIVNSLTSLLGIVNFMPLNCAINSFNKSICLWVVRRTKTSLDSH